MSLLIYRSEQSPVYGIYSTICMHIQLETRYLFSLFKNKKVVADEAV